MPEVVEIRHYAQAVSDILEKAFPISWLALSESHA